MHLRYLAIAVVMGTAGCFHEEDAATTASASAGSDGSADASSTMADVSSGSSSGGAVADESTTAGACEDASFPDRPFDPVPTQLMVLALAGIDPLSFDAAVALPDLQAVVDAEGTRVVFLDFGVGITPFAGACDGCDTGACEHVVHRMLDTADDPAAALLDVTEAYACVLWPPEDGPRQRLLVLSPDEAPPMQVADLMVGLAGAGWDVDLACPGCGDGSASPLAQQLREAGGVISDLDDGEFMAAALTLAIAAPPACGWPSDETPPPPLTTAELRVSIDVCSPDERPCPLALAQVEGLADCDANDPDANEFYVLEDAISVGVSLVAMCDPACTLTRRAVAFNTSIEHDYVCP